MAHESFDVAIVGGGLAGLTLALELSERSRAHAHTPSRIVVLEQRTHYERDRTWSYWRSSTAQQQHRFAHLERQQWRHWRVRHGQQSVTQNGDALYCSIDADAVYTEALRALTLHRNVSVELGANVSDLVSRPTPRACLADGTCIDAKLMFDARPQPATSPSALVQSFTGWEIEFAEPVLDPTTIDLMDFVPDERGLHFFYVLPYDTHRALIETTWISPRSLRTDHTEQLARYIAQRWPGRCYTTRFVERGCLPLARPDIAPLPGIVPIGARAGTLRAATGYAFLNTLHDCHRLAEQFARGVSMPTAYCAHWLDTWMDQVFLRALNDHWLDGPEWFLQMFAGSTGDSMSAFLTGRSSLMQRIAIAKRLPIGVFFKAAFATAEDRPSHVVSAQ